MECREARSSYEHTFWCNRSMVLRSKMEMQPPSEKQAMPGLEQAISLSVDKPRRPSRTNRI
eukprot:scaffold2510_cov43-Prasinocladus_malaysianus.AAC.2